MWQGCLIIKHVGVNHISLNNYKITFFLQEEHLMNKSELVSAVAEKTDFTKADTERALKAFMDTITETLKEGDQVTLIGFGTFLVRERKARTGRNPRTGETIQIKAANNPAFKAGKALKDAVN